MIIKEQHPFTFPFKRWSTDHGLRGSASPVLNATGSVNERWQFLTPPHRMHTPWPITEKFGTGDYVGGLYGCAKLDANPSMHMIWANGWNITIFYIYLFFINSPTGKTRQLIFTLGGSNDADSRKDVTFGGFVDIAPHFGGEIHQKPQFWRLQAKRAKYWKFHVIKTTASISTKFCTTIETIRWSSWVVTIGAQQIQDGGRPPFWKNR